MCLIEGSGAGRAGLESAGLGSRAAGYPADLGRVSLYASHAFTRATFQTAGIALFSIRQEAGAGNEVSRGDRMPLIPADASVLGVTVPFGALTVGVEARHTGRRFLRGDEANQEAPLDWYWLTDLRAAFRLGDWALQGVVRNLLDTGHATFGTFNLNQGAGHALERFLTPARRAPSC